MSDYLIGIPTSVYCDYQSLTKRESIMITCTKAERKAAFIKVFMNNGFNIGGRVGDKSNAGMRYQRGKNAEAPKAE